MKATFLVSLNLNPDESLPSVASQIEGLLENELEVVMVKPWARPKSGPDIQGQAAMQHFTRILHPDLGRQP